MSWIRGRRPSPAMIVAVVALFVSLSGVSYGVATGFIDSRELKNNEVRSVDLRNNDIRTRDLRNNEVRGLDIRNSTVQGRDVALNTLTGDDVTETTLGKVPSATSADTAANASGVSTLRIVPRTTAPFGGADVTLATHGPLTLRARCDEQGGAAVAQLVVVTTESRSAAGGVVTGSASNTAGTFAPELAPGTEQVIASATDSPVQPLRMIALAQLFASAPSGRGFTGQVAMIAENGSPCAFQGGLALQG